MARQGNKSPTPVPPEAASTAGQPRPRQFTPDKATVCGLAPPLSLMETVAVNVLGGGAGGEKVTFTVQDARGATLDPQVLVW